MNKGEDCNNSNIRNVKLILIRIILILIFKFFENFYFSFLNQALNRANIIKIAAIKTRKCIAYFPFIKLLVVSSKIFSGSTANK